MTIDQLVAMAERIHDAEGYDLGASSSREYRNDYWARVIGCAYWGHSVYNPNADRQWHLKNGGPGRPQSDDVAVSLPSRSFWDCIGGAGANGYFFHASGHAEPLPMIQEVYAPPKPKDTGTGPTPPTPTPPPVVPYPGDAAWAKLGTILGDDYRRAGRPGLDDGSVVWTGRVIWDVVAGDETGKKYTLDESIASHRPEWCAALGIPVT